VGYKRGVRSSARERIKKETIKEYVYRIKNPKVEVSAIIYNSNDLSANLEFKVTGTYNGRNVRNYFFFKANTSSSAKRAMNKLDLVDNMGGDIYIKSSAWKLFKMLGAY